MSNLEVMDFVIILSLTFSGCIAIDPYSIPTSMDWNISRTLASVISDEFWREIVATELVYCPQSSYCSPMFTRPDYSDYGFTAKCCQPCQCQAFCSYLAECCPTLKMPNASAFIDGPMPSPHPEFVCRFPQQLTNLVNSSIHATSSYIMVVSCPLDWPQDDIRWQCENGQYIYLDSTNISTPVTSTDTYAVYKNSACAVCNGKSENSLQKWDSEIICLEPITKDTMLNIQRKILIENVCNLIFNTPTLMIECDWGYISSCNITGEWQQYDPFVEAACHSYTSVYLKRYRNVFCYMCNSNTPPSLLCLETSGQHDYVTEFKFSAIFDFQGIFEKIKESKAVMKGNNRNTTCSTGEIYNNITNTCSEIFCEDRLLYNASSQTCSPLFKEIDMMRYDVAINFTFTFVTNIDRECVNCVSGMADSIYERLREWLQEKEISDRVCDLRILVALNDLNLEAQYLVATIMMMATHKHDSFHILSSVVRTFDNTYFAIITEDQNVVQFKLNLISNFSRHFNETSLRGMFLGPNGETLVPLVEKPRFTIECLTASSNVNPISSLSLCPRVLIPGAKIEADDMHASVSGSKRQIQTNEFILDQSGSVVVCLETFKDVLKHSILHLKMEESPDITVVQYAEGIVSIFCVCITIFSLLITVITYSIFKSLRTAPGINNIFLSVYLVLANVFFLFSRELYFNFRLCQAAALLTHFLWLCGMFWLNICCIHMFNVFRSIDKISIDKNSARRLVIYNLYGTVGPSLFIAINIAFSQTKNGDTGYGGRACFIVNPLMNLVTFALPIALIVLANLVMFFVVICTIQRLKNGAQSTATRNCFLIYIKLSALTGVSWIFGYIHEFSQIRAFSFVFTILTASQGLFIMLAFICNKRVLSMYKALCSRHKPVKRASAMSSISGSVYVSSDTNIAPTTTSSTKM